MIEKETTQTQTDRGSDIKTKPAIWISLFKRQKPQSLSNQEESNSGSTTHYGQRVFWVFIAICLVILVIFPKVRCFIEAHSASVSALGSVAIVFLTYAYVRYSHHQWQVMDGQLGVMRKQIELQKIHLKQWVEIGNWRGGNIIHNADMKRRWLVSYFDIVNATNNPLTLTRIAINARGDGSAQGFQHLLTPKSKYSGELIIQLTPEEADNFVTTDKPIVCRVTIDITFTDVMTNEVVQPFRFTALYKYGSPVQMDNKWG